MRHIAGFLVSALVVAATVGPPAFAQTFNSGSTGADGAFSPTAATTLALPESGVFNFTTIDIPAGVTVKFVRNATNTPVTLLASGNVTIAGTIDIAGAPGAAPTSVTAVGSNGGVGGPGGFDGGSGATGFVSTTGGSGLGPGGGAGSTGTWAGAGGAGALVRGDDGRASNLGVAGGGGAAYGTPSLLPLVGGSGGGGGGGPAGTTGGGGGGGGGAILIASSGTLSMTSTGSILADGGAGGGGVSQSSTGGGGSGGSVRLLATSITGSGTIRIRGGSGGGTQLFPAGSGSAGRLRVEASTNTLSVNVGQLPAGAVTSGAPTSVTLTNAPTLRIASVGGVAAPAAPTGSFTAADVVLPPGTVSPVTVTLHASNIPLGTVMTVSAKGQYGDASSAASSPLTGSLSASTASASVTIPTDQPSVVSASASFTLVAANGNGPVFVHGEEVEQVRVTSTLNGASQVVYVTRSGREIVLAR